MKKHSSILSALLATSALITCQTSHAQQITNFPVISLNAGINLIKAEVASSEAEREQGLMYRTKLGQNEGMVFLFGAPAQVCMWMKNTMIPLSVAFIDAKGKIINIEEMKAETLDSHCGNKQVNYALEMDTGWFAKKHIKPGTTIDGLPGVEK